MGGRNERNGDHVTRRVYRANPSFLRKHNTFKYCQKKLRSTPGNEIFNLFLQLTFAQPKAGGQGPKLIIFLPLMCFFCAKNLAALSPGLMTGISADIGCSAPTKQLHQKPPKMQAHVSTTIHKEG